MEGVTWSNRNPEDLGGGSGMNVFILLERLHQRFILGEVSKNPQFNLRIVGRSDQPSVLWNKGLTNSIALFCTNGDVLKVGSLEESLPVAVIVWL